MGAIAIMPKDQAMFAEQGQGIRDYVEKNHEALMNGDSKAMMGFQQLYGNYTTQAEMSKNYREKWEANGAMMAKDKDAYDSDVWDAHMQRASSEDAGNWVDDSTIYQKNINLLDDIIGPTYKYAEDKAKNTPYGKVYTPDEAKKLLWEKSKDGPTFRQIVKDFNKLPEKERLGKTDPVDWYIEKYTPMITIDDKDPYKSSSGDGQKTKSKSVSGVRIYGNDGKVNEVKFNFNGKWRDNRPYSNVFSKKAEWRHIFKGDN
jgi:hypothetical protein